MRLLGWALALTFVGAFTYQAIFAVDEALP